METKFENENRKGCLKTLSLPPTSWLGFDEIMNRDRLRKS
jgi:hypothetical protein